MEVSFDEVQVFGVKGGVDEALEGGKEGQWLYLPWLHLPMIFQNLYPIFFPFDLVGEIVVVVNEKMEKRGDDDIECAGRIAVAVDGEVEVDGDHRVVGNLADLQAMY